MIIFYIDKKAYTAIINRNMRDVVVSIQWAYEAGEEVRFACEELQQALQTKVLEVRRFPRSDTMILGIGDIVEVDYDLCA